MSPEFEAPTKKMRAALPLEIAMADFACNSSQAVAVLEGDMAGLGKALLGDRIVELGLLIASLDDDCNSGYI